MTDVIAHRGASARERENTTAAFRRAVALGADGIELDARLAGGGLLLVHHDAVLPDGRPVHALTLDDRPADLPTLSEALDACAGVVVNIELKNDPSDAGFDPADAVAERVADLLTERPEPGSCWLVSSFRVEALDRFLAHRPDVATAWLTIDRSPTGLESVARRGHVGVHPWVETVTAEFVAVAHGHGLRVNVWTCNDPARAQELAAWGVDGVITDVPDVILRALGRPTPA